MLMQILIFLALTAFLHLNEITAVSAHCTNGINKNNNFRRQFNHTFSLVAEKLHTTYMQKGQNARYVHISNIIFDEYCKILDEILLF